MSFVVLATAASVILALLNFLPALSLGSVADGLLQLLRRRPSSTAGSTGARPS
ncbi:hypothetical protein [Streptomyces gardneri]|uniref:hypothetical protein n=1 Tax=Streptomyces gardneri TaxID=66892 RepID=UPI00142EB17B|nr:hypothetical protein [Streptomyces gardneri]